MATAAKKLPKIGKLVSRFAIVFLFPAFVTTSIYLDWDHTRQWKLAEIERIAASKSEFQN